MANTYKNIVITPNIGNTADPKIQFSGGNTTVNTDINLYVYPDANGTLSFEGSAGQLFSITNDLANLLFSVADVSGIPSLEVYANGLVSIAPLGGNVVFGNTSELILSPGAGIYANGGLGTAGQVLHSNGTSIYWAADDQGVTSVATGNGITGGTITSTGTLSVVAGTGTVVNVTGVHVNATYIGTLSANNTTYVNGKTEGNLNVNSATTALTANNATNLGGVAAANYARVDTADSFDGVITFNANVVMTKALSANGGFGTAGQVLTSGAAGNVYWATPTVGDITAVTAGNGLTGGGTSGDVTLTVGAANGITVSATTVGVTQGTGTVVNATGVHVNATYIGTLSANNTTYLNNKTESNLNVNTALTANNTTYLNNQLAAYYTNATNITTGTLPYAQIPANVINTTSAFTVTGVHTYNANVILSAGLSANGGFGTAGHVLHSNGTATYWAPDDNSGGTVTSVATGNGLTGGTITTTGTVSVLANTGIVANATGVYVNSAYIATISANNASFLGTVAAANYARLDTAGTFAGRMSATASQSTSILTANGALGGIELLASNSTTAAFMSFHRPAAYASYFGIDTDNNFAVGGWSAGAGLGLMKVGSFGVGTAASGTAGEIRATNNITAYYSDKRLKTDIRQIEEALDKVNKISGVTFVSNEEAAKYGYTDKKIQVGVIAQEIEAVLPEVVVPAPFDIVKADDGTEYSKSGQNYKTVQYEKLVPLLIEAIKELTSKVQTLEEQIEVLKK